MTRQFSKTVAIKATDDDEMTATGVVLTPNELDRQLDFLRPEGVRNLFNADPDDGVMHAAFPDDHAELERNEVLEESETIDGEEFDAGDWIIRRRYHDDQRWALVKSGALSSFSIGGGISEEREFESLDDLPDDVDVPAAVNPDTVPDKHWPPAELIDGQVDEISDVDMGAVPSADMAVVKSIGKSPLDRVDSEDEFVRLMDQRGTMDDDGARELWRYMQEAEKSAEAGKQDLPEPVKECKDSILQDNPDMSESDAIAVCRAELGMAADTDGNEPAESGADSPDKDAMSDTETDGEQSDDASKLDDVDDVDDATLGARLKSALGLGSAADDDGNSSEDSGSDAAKAGRTLSERNQRSVMAAIDAQLDMLDDAGVDHGMTRFSDRDDVDFDLGEFGRSGHYDEKNAPDGDTSDDTMTDDELTETVEALEEKVDALTEKLDEADDGDDTEKADEQTDDNDDELAEKLDELTEKVDGLDDRVDAVAKGAADTDQIEGGEGGSNERDETSAFKAALGGN